MLVTTKAETLALINNIFNHSYRIQFNFENICRITTIVDEILRNPAALIFLTDLYVHNYQTFVHSVNVCLLATMIGLKAGYTEESLQELALGSLLHDLGKVLVPSEIFHSPGKTLSWRMENHSEP